jgi:hypothetical protein
VRGHVWQRYTPELNLPGRIILEVPYDGSWDDWVVHFLQMLHDRVAAGSQLQKVRIVSNPGVQIPRLEEEKREQIAKFVRSVEIEYFW